MSAPKHIQRDGHYVSPFIPASDISYVLNTIGVLPPSAGIQPIIFYDYGNVTASEEVTIPDGGYALIGIVIDPPRKDRLPYRVKANVQGAGAIILGNVAPGDVAVSPVAVLNRRVIPFRDTFDDLIIVSPDTSVEDGEYDPLFIGVATYDENPGATAVTLSSSLSVQNLGIKPPTMQNAVS